MHAFLTPVKGGCHRPCHIGFAIVFTRNWYLVMVERSHTAGWLPPQVAAPLQKLGERLADWFAPKADGAMTEGGYEIRVELPGVLADDIDISVQDDMIIVQGEKQFAREEQGRTFFFSEREYGAFQRSFRLPPDAKKDSVDAVFRNGVLTLSIPKARALAQDARKIAVRAE